jgi:hypothetical protein
MGSDKRYYWTIKPIMADRLKLRVPKSVTVLQRMNLRSLFLDMAAAAAMRNLSIV